MKQTLYQKVLDHDWSTKKDRNQAGHLLKENRVEDSEEGIFLEFWRKSQWVQEIKARRVAKAIGRPREKKINPYNLGR